MPHHGVMAAMVVLGVEVANGKDSQRDADHCQHEKGKDSHATLPGKRYGEPDSPLFPKLGYKKNSLLSVTSGLPMSGVAYRRKPLSWYY